VVRDLRNLKVNSRISWHAFWIHQEDSFLLSWSSPTTRTWLGEEHPGRPWILGTTAKAHKIAELDTQSKSRADMNLLLLVLFMSLVITTMASLVCPDEYPTPNSSCDDFLASTSTNSLTCSYNYVWFPMYNDKAGKCTGQSVCQPIDQCQCHPNDPLWRCTSYGMIDCSDNPKIGTSC